LYFPLGDSGALSVTSREQGNKLNRSPRVREMERAILTLAGIGEALSAPDVSQWTLIRIGVLQGLGLGLRFVRRMHLGET
jgi:hypothetical protein